jgi:hypothetical protein
MAWPPLVCIRVVRAIRGSRAHTSAVRSDLSGPIGTYRNLLGPKESENQPLIHGDKLQMPAPLYGLLRSITVYCGLKSVKPSRGFPVKFRPVSSNFDQKM